MLVSWNWLKDYVPLTVDAERIADRLTMAGLNHEGTVPIGDDLAIDLEVTSNRPDCLGHIGVAREIAVLTNSELSLPKAEPNRSQTSVSELAKVTIDSPELCYRYTARVIRGVRVGPSPDWLVRRLHTINIGTINNVVDVSNYVLMECGQPLHAFDLSRLAQREIVVREARTGEELVAIDHKTYPLQPGMCVIADAVRPVALGGVMGGAETEVGGETTDLLIESAEFDPISVRNTSRALKLKSPSSYRFERGVDPAGVDWASRRCCELILDLAGGELADDVIDIGRRVTQRDPVVLRLSQLPRILGIQIDRDHVQKILLALECQELRADKKSVEVRPPSWRRDLVREIDLVEEVARIHGYDEIPEDARVPMVPSHRTDEDRVLQKVRSVLTAAGFDEAMTYSAISEDWSSAFSPWSPAEQLRSSTPMLLGADCLRRSLVPSLLGARRVNESLANPVIELFETACVYLPREDGLPQEETMLGITSDRDFGVVKGVLEALVTALNAQAFLEAIKTEQTLLEPGRSCQLLLDGQLCGYVGEVTADGLKQFGLRNPATVGEVKLWALQSIADLVPQHQKQSPYPAISRDLNLIVDERVCWADISTAVRAAGGEFLEGVAYRETYRHPEQLDGADKKRLLFSITLRSSGRTLTNEEADQIRDRIERACREQHGALLVA